MIKAKSWNGSDLRGTWKATVKLDGVRALWDGEKWVSRAGKPLYNIPPWYEGMAKDIEVYVGSFKDTITAVRTKNPTKDTPKVKRSHMFELDPMESGIFVWERENPTAHEIVATMEDLVSMGFEGIVLRQGDRWLKVKPEETYDVPVTGVVEGTGKNAGRLGALVTPMGEVGTGFTDEERTMAWDWHLGRLGEEWPLIGSIVEVSCMHLTREGKFRHPRFVRFRLDKA